MYMLLFIIAFIIGLFVTSISTFVNAKISSKPRKIVVNNNRGITVYDRFYSNVSKQFIENNIN